MVQQCVNCSVGQGMYVTCVQMDMVCWHATDMPRVWVTQSANSFFGQNKLTEGYVCSWLCVTHSIASANTGPT